MDRCSQSALSRDEAAAYGVCPKGRLGHAPARGPPSKNTRKVGGLRRGGPCPEACPERREELGSTRRAPCAGAKPRFLAVPAPRRPHTPPSLGPGVSHLRPLHTRSGNMSLVPREQERVATAGRAQPPRRGGRRPEQSHRARSAEPAAPAAQTPRTGVHFYCVQAAELCFLTPLSPAHTTHLKTKIYNIDSAVSPQLFF